MSQSINRITLKGYKSIRSLEEFELNGINVLIGANGSGKSNFVSFFHLLRELVEGRLENAVNKAGGADTQLYLGPKVTEKIEARLVFGRNAYKFKLEVTADDRLIFGDERIEYEGTPGYTRSVDRSIGTGHGESKLKFEIETNSRNKAISEYIYDAISSWTVYHVHDTSNTAAMRRPGSVRDYERLRPDGGNLAAFLYWLQVNDEPSYRLIQETVQIVAPFFNDFKLRPMERSDDTVVQLEWEQKGSDYPFHPSQLSDGTLRFIALATALLQPHPPATILIDEPELGLHPSALDVLASLIRQAVQRTQLIISTQSVSLVNSFDPEHIVVIDRDNGESRFRRLDKDELGSWLDDYSLGELWQKNVYGGSPSHE